MAEKKITRLALVDDHKLFRGGLKTLIEMVDSRYQILFEANDGFDMQRQLQKKGSPDMVLMDINMPGMDGFLSVEWLRKNYPQLKILVISMVQNEESIIKMLRYGVSGYLSKDVEPKELGEALNAILDKGHYYTDFITGKLIHALQNDESPQRNTAVAFSSISEREMKFIELACSDVTYQEIAEKMCLSPRTIDGYRDTVFEKLNVKSRTGMMLAAIRHGVVKL